MQTFIVKSRLAEYYKLDLSVQSDTNSVTLIMLEAVFITVLLYVCISAALADIKCLGAANQVVAGVD